MTVDDVLPALRDATEKLVGDCAGLGEADAREPSRLPGWSRGHVLSHLARNAEGGVRLLSWALTGIRTYEYESLSQRAADIEGGAHRPASVLVRDVADTGRLFNDLAAVLPGWAWERSVTYTTGQARTADNIVTRRWAEVLIHHVDLRLSYSPGDWPPQFMDWMLPFVVDDLNERGKAPLAAVLELADSGTSLVLGAEQQPALPTLRGTRAEFLAWLLGRTDGSGIEGAEGKPLPGAASVYAV